MEYSIEYMLKEALEEIANPIWFMQQRAEKEGNKIDGMYAISLAKDPVYLQQIAKAVLDTVSNIEEERKKKSDQESKGWEDQRETMFTAWKRSQENN